MCRPAPLLRSAGESFLLAAPQTLGLLVTAPAPEHPRAALGTAVEGGTREAQLKCYIWGEEVELLIVT